MNQMSTTATMQSRARQLYRDLGPQVDETTATRLRNARQTALEAASKRHRPARWMVPSSAFAVAVVAVLVVWQPLQHSVPVATLAPAASQSMTTNVLPPDTGHADPAMYQNLDFYAWLAHQPNARSQGKD